MSGYHYTATPSTSGSGPAWTRSEPLARWKFVELMRTCALPSAYPRSRNFMPRSHMLWSLVTPHWPELGRMLTTREIYLPCTQAS